MATIVAPSDFKGEITIAQSGGTVSAVDNNLQWFINKYEPKFLKELFGDTLYAEFIAGLALTPPDNAIWVALRDETGLKDMIANYVYYHYQINEATQPGGSGATKPKVDNATMASGNDKYIRAWNEMVEAVRLFDLSTETYPDWHRVYWRDYWHGCGWNLKEIYCFKNTLNI